MAAPFKVELQAPHWHHSVQLFVGLALTAGSLAFILLGNLGEAPYVYHAEVLPVARAQVQGTNQLHRASAPLQVLAQPSTRKVAAGAISAAAPAAPGPALAAASSPSARSLKVLTSGPGLWALLGMGLAVLWLWWWRPATPEPLVACAVMGHSAPSEHTPLTTIRLHASAASTADSSGPTNILIFGPNGSGKGTQGTLIKDQYEGMAHIESGAIFRDNIKGGTELGKKAKEYIDKGALVPDEITIPMILDTLKTKGSEGFLLDGFPRNMVQAEKLWEALVKEGIPLSYVVEIELDREIAKNRIMGRRLCSNDPNHPNNISIDAIKPEGDKCRVCGGDLTARADDQDEAAIATRHDIYYNTVDGTLAAAQFYNNLAAEGKVQYITLDGQGSISEVKANLLASLGKA